MAEKQPVGIFLPTSSGGVVRVQPLVGEERDEITNLVMRLKKADERARKLELHTDETRAPTAVEVKFAEDWQLPREVFEYFTLEEAA